MKKFFTFVLSIVMSVSFLTGCGATQPDDARHDENLLLDANVLTGYLCNSLNNRKTPEEAEFDYIEFIFECLFNKDQPDFCYYDPTPLDEKSDDLVINLETSRKIIYQVFGMEWDITQHTEGYATDVYDEYMLFPTALDWGLMDYSAGDYIYSEFGDNNQVISHFDLNGPDWDDGDIATKPYGRYIIIYDIINEDGEEFLRFNRFEKE